MSSFHRMTELNAITIQITLLTFSRKLRLHRTIIRWHKPRNVRFKRHFRRPAHNNSCRANAKWLCHTKNTNSHTINIDLLNALLYAFIAFTLLIFGAYDLHHIEHNWLNWNQFISTTEITCGSLFTACQINWKFVLHAQTSRSII